MSASFQQIEKISLAVGTSAALRLAAFFGGTGKNLYVPLEATPGHLIEKLIGAEAFGYLVEAFAGENVWMPAVDLAPLQAAGKVWMLRQSELSNSQIGNLLGLSKQRISQINAALRRDGFLDLAAELEPTNVGEQS